MQTDLPFDIDKSKLLDFKNRVDFCTIRKENLSYCYSQTEIDTLLMFKFQEQSNYNQLAFRITPFLEYKREKLYKNELIATYSLGDSKDCESIKAISKKIVNGKIKSFANKRFINYVQIGSTRKNLYAKFIHDSLKDCASYVDKKYHVDFILNDDFVNIENILGKVNIEETLFIFDNHTKLSSIVLEVKKNIKRIYPSLQDSDIEKNFLCITENYSKYYSKLSIQDTREQYDDFCILSSVSCTLNFIVYGSEIIESILLGARYIDEISRDSDITQNFVMLASVYSFFENNKKKKEMSLFIPYAQGLSLLPQVVQSIFMNLNCKNINSDGNISEIETESFVFGSTGGIAQETLFQGLHKGTHLFSAEFIGFRDRKNLLNEMIFQSLLLFFGRKDENFYGGRCNTMLIFDRLNPKSIGNIISYYENRAIFQSFVYNVDTKNRYDILLPKSDNEKNSYINTILDFF